MQATLPSTTNARTLLTDGIRALHSSDNAHARTLLSEAVTLDPQSEQGWLWLSGAVETDSERVRCLQQVLRLNPQSAAALQGLRMLGALPEELIPEPVAAPVPAPAVHYDPAFDRDRFLLRQKVAVREKYLVWDEYDQPILYIERPRYLLRNLFGFMGAAFFGVIMFLIFLVPAIAAASLPGRIFSGFMACVAIVFTVVVPLLVAQKRPVTIYRDESKQEPLLTILQDHKVWVINTTYTITDTSGQMLARLHKNHLYNMIRKRWYCYGPDQALLCMAKEDSMLRSFLRRAFSQLGAIGTLVMPLLRTNFVILGGAEAATPIGMFNRKMTLLDRYVLDMSADPARTIDRRVALALGVMLDCGERR